ncbi:MAG: lipoprotein insertase outer membrane protein LolB [Bacillota bacterium]
MTAALRLTLLAAGVFSLAACASLQEHAPEGPANGTAWAARQAELAALTDWELSGRVAIIEGKDGGSGSLDWKQQGNRLSFDFRGPLGAGAVHIEGEGNTLRVKTSRGDDFVTDDPELDFAERLHMPLPVLSMRYWMLGLPDPAAPYDKDMDAQGELTHLKQGGWRVDYLEYADVQGHNLPSRVTLARDDVRIKLVMDAWTLNPPPSSPL